jgi:hypothetical protein
MRGSSSTAQRKSAAAVAAVVLVWLVTTLLWLTPGLTRPDGAGYFAYLPSTYFDRDLLFFDEWNEVRLIRDGQILFKDKTQTGHLSNHWTAGAALAWYPAFVAADVVARGNGFQVMYVAAVAFTSALAGLVVLWCGLRAVRELWVEGCGFRGLCGAIACIAIWLGSPLAFYSTRHATMSHAISAAACAAVVMLSLRLRSPLNSQLTTHNLFAIGLAIGFACATRPQNVTIGLVPFLLLPATLKRAHVIAAGALLAALPQLIVSQTLWGAPLAFVNIGAEAHPWRMFETFRPLETLFSWYHGLATWTPLLMIAIGGLVLLWKHDRALARAGLVTFISQWLLLSLLERWFWGGLSFGQRRFDSCTLFFIIGLAAFLRSFPRLGTLLTALTTAWTMVLFIAVPKFNLNKYQSPGDLIFAFRDAVAEPQWRTFLGYAPPQLRGEIVIAMLVTTVTFAAIYVLARKQGTILAAVYLACMSAFFLWCGMHPKHDALSRTLIATPMPSGALVGTAGLLRDEADYLMRTGRMEEARKALRESNEIRP